MNLIFMGTGEYAKTALEAIVQHYGKDNTVSVFTKADRPAGRGMQVRRAAVAAYAEEKGLPLYQPKTLRESESGELFRSIAPDLVIVASYGLLLPPYILSEPKYGCVNIHASLLPRYRGAAPINRCIMDGEKESGVTIMQMDEGLDTGAILLQRKIAIAENEDAGSLFERLSCLGAELMLEAMPAILAGKLSPVPQDEALQTYAAKITAADQKIDWSEASSRICDRIRGLSPFPGALSHMEKDGKILKIYQASPQADESDAAPGEVIAVSPRVLVKAGDGAVALETVQPEGKPRMRAQDLVNGRKIAVGDRFCL